MLGTQWGSEGFLPCPGPHPGESGPHLACPRLPAEAVVPTPVPGSGRGAKLGSPVPGLLMLTFSVETNTKPSRFMYCMTERKKILNVPQKRQYILYFVKC